MRRNRAEHHQLEPGVGVGGVDEFVQGGKVAEQRAGADLGVGGHPGRGGAVKAVAAVAVNGRVEEAGAGGVRLV